jgi:hypothetical protein
MKVCRKRKKKRCKIEEMKKKMEEENMNAEKTIP